MAGVRITIDAQGIDPLQARVRGLARMDTSSLMPMLGEYLLDSTRARFGPQQAPDGTPWATLAPRTSARKKHNPSKILTERGFLRKNLRYQVLSSSAVQVGSNLTYAATHQYGRDNIPPRPYLGLSRADRSEILEIIADWAAELGFK